ncbi:MAG TPA: helix-turn-helix transcriptional regulator [Calditrichia bacterium]|nr:helix-turn-helix transcriptional regulator [Calditrichia bacterium]
MRVDEVPEYIEELEEKVAKLERRIESSQLKNIRRRENGDPILGLNLTRLRKEHGWSTRKVAAKAEMSQSFYCLIEDARSGCSLVKLRNLAKAFNVSVEELTTHPDEQQHLQEH